MTNPLGFVLPGASIGFGSLLIRPRRGFFPTDSDPIIAQAVIEERHTDELEITEHPVEQGAAIADHAFKRPAEIVIHCGWSDSPSGPGSLLNQAVGAGAAVLGSAVGLPTAVAGAAAGVQSILKGNSSDQVKAIYAKLLDLQQKRVPFDVFTGKRAYTNMLFRSIGITTDKNTENSLFVVAVCRQVIIVQTQVVSVAGDPADQALPEKTQSLKDLGPQSLLPAPNFIPDVGSLSSGLTDSLSGLQDSIGGVLDSLPTNLTGTLDQLNSTISNVLTEVPGAFTQLQSSLDGVLNQIPSMIDNLPLGPTQLLTQVQDQITEVIKQLPEPFEIPLKSFAQTMSVSLGPDGVSNKLKAIWNAASQCWVADVATADGTPVVSGVPLVSGADLVEQFGYLDFPGKLIAQTDNDADQPPGFNNLGSTGHLYLVS